MDRRNGYPKGIAFRKNGFRFGIIMKQPPKSYDYLYLDGSLKEKDRRDFMRLRGEILHNLRAERLGSLGWRDSIKIATNNKGIYYLEVTGPKATRRMPSGGDTGSTWVRITDKSSLYTLRRLVKSEKKHGRHRFIS
ncbi:MAG: hypothetical protein ABIE23_03375 [archaeon]